jgi:hypothetical protein
MAKIQTKLGVVNRPLPQAAVLKPSDLPLFKGKDDLEDLLCGRCSAVVCESVTPLTLKTLFGTSHQLIVECPRCDTYNVLPSTLVPSSRGSPPTT